MLHTEPEVLMIAEYLRQMGATYTIGKQKIEGWKKKFIELSRNLKTLKKGTIEYKRSYAERVRILKEIEEFYDAEDFWFEGQEGSVEEFFEKYHLNLLGWDVDYFKRMVKNDRVNIRPKGTNKYANHTGTEQVERQEVLSDNDGERGEFGRGYSTGTIGLGSGNRPPVIRRAVALAGCVC